MSAPEYERIKSVIRAKTGIELENDKDYLIPARLSSMLEEFKISSYDELAESISRNGNPAMEELFLDRISTHETLFFRDESIFTALTKQIVPEWNSRSPSTERKLRIWSAACSTGQEPYSIMILLKENLPHIYDRTEITATDLSPVTIQQARDGIYTKNEMSRGMPEEYLAKYFQPHNSGYRIVDSIKARIQFSVLNLLNMPYPGEYDIVLCRNVLIYFDHPTRKLILEAIRKSMRTDSTLILGSAESLIGFMENYILRECGLARYYELNSSNVTIFKR